MVSPEALRRVRDILFKELVLPGDTGFWGVGIDNDDYRNHTSNYCGLDAEESPHQLTNTMSPSLNDYRHAASAHRALRVLWFTEAIVAWFMVTAFVVCEQCVMIVHNRVLRPFREYSIPISGWLYKLVSYFRS